MSLYASFTTPLFSLSSLLARALMRSLYRSRCCHPPQGPPRSWLGTAGCTAQCTNQPRWPRLLAKGEIAFEQFLSWCWALLPALRCLWVGIPAPPPPSFPLLPPGSSQGCANRCQSPSPPKCGESRGRRLRYASASGTCQDVARRAFPEQKCCQKPPQIAR